MDRKKIFWAIASAFIAILSIWTVVSQSKHFSFEILMSFIRNANKGWLFMSFVCTFGFIWFEGFALVRMARHFGTKPARLMVLCMVELMCIFRLLHHRHREDSQPVRIS